MAISIIFPPILFRNPPIAIPFNSSPMKLTMGLIAIPQYF